MQVGWSVFSSSTLRVVTELGKSATNRTKVEKIKILSFTTRKKMVDLKARIETGKRIRGVSFALHFWLDYKKN